MMRRIYDITMEMKPGMLVYPGDRGVTVEESSLISRGDVCNNSVLTFGLHTGTHFDAPKHFVDDGKCGHELELEHFMGKARVIEIQEKVAIGEEELAGLEIKKGDILLLKTENSKFLKESKFRFDHVHLTLSAAKFLVNAGVLTLGFDYLTVEKADPDLIFPVHKCLLSAGMVIIEGLDLSEVPAGEYEFHALPLKLVGNNGGPVRAVLTSIE